MKKIFAFAMVLSILGGIVAGCSQPAEGDTAKTDTPKTDTPKTTGDGE